MITGEIYVCSVLQCLDNPKHHAVYEHYPLLHHTWASQQPIRREVEKYLELNGWKDTPGGWLCPKCVAKYARRAKADERARQKAKKAERKTA
jgi:hypothetical protein